MSLIVAAGAQAHKIALDQPQLWCVVDRHDVVHLSRWVMTSLQDTVLTDRIVGTETLAMDSPLVVVVIRPLRRRTASVDLTGLHSTTVAELFHGISKISNIVLGVLAQKEVFPHEKGPQIKSEGLC